MPYGRAPYVVDLTNFKGEVHVVRAAAAPEAPPLAPLIDAALDAPIDRPPLADLARGAPRVTIVVSDPSRAEPRAAFVAAIRARLPAGARITIAVATGTHGPADLLALGLPADLLAGATIVNHDGHAATDLVEIGTTPRGTPVRLHRCLLDAELVVATGSIKPHYFAGFGAGVKAFFPGLGEAKAVRINHAMKTHPRAVAGVVDGNPVRDDLEDAFRLLQTPSFLLNGVCGPEGDARSSTIRAVVAGDPVTAFRTGCELARPWFTARAPRSPLVIASDALPVSASLYQAAKIAAAAAPLVAENGTLAIVAECPEGTGPLETVNEAILRIGVLPRLPAGARLVVVSGLPRSVVETTLCAYAPSVVSLLDELVASSHDQRITVIPRASQLLLEAR
ncbi:MAG TPA: lactate racemase domain-containing protein [Kofleriaceae bacterium]|jgi:nickel-dependent lactate racemase